jgi:hypothetical protein
MFRVYSGPPGAEALNPLDMGRYLYKEFEGLDEAMGFAHHLRATGHVPLLIEGDDGTHLDRKDLAKALHHRSNEQTHGAW